MKSAHPTPKREESMRTIADSLRLVALVARLDASLASASTHADVLSKTVEAFSEYRLSPTQAVLGLASVPVCSVECGQEADGVVGLKQIAETSAHPRQFVR